MKSTATTLSRKTFSEVETLTDLQDLPGSSGHYGCRQQPIIPPPSDAFVEAVIGDKLQLCQVSEAFANLFLPEPPAASEFPPPLKELCQLIEFCSVRSHKHFHNGAGKLFVYELLKLRDLSKSYTTPWFTKISTTANPKNDWCGFKEGPVRGVVDIEMEARSGQVVGLGEVKGDGEGLYQLLAAMQGHRNKSGHWPVGFVATKSDIQLVEPLERRGSVMVTLTSFTTARLNHLLSFVEQLVQMIAANHLIAATKGLTIATPRHIENEERLETTEKGFKERKKELVHEI